MDKSKLIHARTCVDNVNYHIVWSAKYRKPVLINGIDQTLKKLMTQIAKDKSFVIRAMEIMPDHVQKKGESRFCIFFMQQQNM